jgi:hypothetical protein
MDDVKLALLGDRDAQERLTERGVLVPCHCGGEMEIMIPKGIAEYPADIYYRPRCKECFAIGAAGRTAKQAIRFWNTRAPILSSREMEMLDEH